MKPDPDYAEYLAQWSKAYQRLNYDQGLSARFLSKSHEWAETAYSERDYFPQVLEVGAGTGAHLRYVRHRYDKYTMTDAHPEMMGQIVPAGVAAAKVSIEQQDAAHLGYADGQFDRLIATHVLEHLEQPHKVLREWNRVVRPGGIISLVLPCDPGVMWRLGRAVGSRRKFEQVGMAYDYWMAREHINAINNLVALIRYYFDDVDERWHPLRVPSMDLNLFYICHIRV